MDSLLIYGSYGYTGRLIAREAVARGGSPTLAGRNGDRVARQAEDLGLEGRAIDLTDGPLEDDLEAFDAVLNCAGPFERTAEPLVLACLEAGTDYLDITGEFPVFERLRQYGETASAAGITLLPGVGFDVVPTDCLAAMLHERLPTADRLQLGVKSEYGFSPGTARTFVELAGEGGVIRRDGRLLSVPAAFRSRKIDFGEGPEHAVTIPLGDVVTAAHTTGIETVEVYGAVPEWSKPLLSATDSLGWLLERPSVERAATRAIDALLDGPDGTALATESATVWGEVVDDDSGERHSGRLRTPNPYALTADAAVSAVERLLEDGVENGFQTPASAFGSAFVTELAGVERELLEADAEGSAVPEPAD
ncbi:saccharopine dehydrogenase [Natronococcus amylolyticus DSM 10524]|uniref:Saccharopine dehydrogenase n=1 Tax=Natronococcus amylolyticus DSM 10524 TaxID=1227497 RepID=L9XFC0_9EURY|nr:saccharopine dehydrogenase NADP-binding domain-containing protein [Natronococcus amylolyticus]ELY60415.1 saccharopine dehydrogenase [Natronococcus amylolyticus DSM 10524]